jgi:hypothetical protein
MKNYQYKDFFIAKEGLYLSINHPDNPSADFNKFKFELFKLNEK